MAKRGTVGAQRGGEGDGPGDDEAPGSPADAGPLAGELAAIDRALDRSTKIVAGGGGEAGLRFRRAQLVGKAGEGVAKPSPRSADL